MTGFEPYESQQSDEFGAAEVRAIDEALYSLASKEGMRFFVGDLQRAGHKQVALPMNLVLVLRRLRSGFYRQAVRA